MPNKKFIDELRQLLIRRGKVSREQLHYAMVEVNVMKQMYPITKPCEEKRFSHLRTLESYIGGHALNLKTV